MHRLLAPAGIIGTILIVGCGNSVAAVDSGMDVVDVPSPSDVVALGSLGAPCTTVSQCASGICLPIGRCTQPCMGPSDCPSFSNWRCISLPSIPHPVCGCQPTGTTGSACAGIDDQCTGVSYARTCAGTCADISSDNGNCGGCGIECAGGSTCQGGICACAPGTTVCGTSCVATMTSLQNCGACGVVCQTGANSTPQCTGGRCIPMCFRGFGDCDGNALNGCETPLNTIAHCGSCTTNCLTSQACQGGTCASCGPGQMLCGSSCLDVTSDGNNCGSCDHVCPTSQRCASGTCSFCPAGQALCGGSCIDVTSDAHNCGSCGHACATGQNCVLGSCTCPAPTVLCGGGCVDTSSDTSNCGACGTVCPTSAPRCTTGACNACSTGALNGIGIPAGTVASATATYTTYTANLTIDGDLATAWNAPGPSASLTLMFPTPTAISGVRLAVDASPATSETHTITADGGPTPIGSATNTVTIGPVPAYQALPAIPITPGTYSSLTIAVNAGASWAAINEISLLTAACP